MGSRSRVLVLGLLALLVLGGCGAVRQVPVRQTQRDSVRTQVRYVERWHVDTVRVPLAAQRATVSRFDTVSELRNQYCASRAQVGPDGLLTHELHALPVRVPVVVRWREVRHDTTLYRDRVEVRERVLEVAKPLGWYQRLCVRGFPWVLLLAVGLLALWLWRLFR